MRSIVCCSWFDRCLCFWASRKRKPLITIQLALQGLVLLLLLVQLGLETAASYDVVAGAPTFSLEWRFDDFAKDLWGAKDRSFNAWDGTVHFNLNRVAFETNLTNNPRICRTRPEICLDSEPDGSLRRFSWPLSKFRQVVQREIDGYASQLLFPPVAFPFGPQPFGSGPTDAPWYFDLAVTSEGHVCGEINKYAYSYGSASGMFDCNRVWDPDGSVHGNAHSYGPYEGMTISLSIMFNDDGNSWRLCDTPEASIWGDFSECYDDSICTSPDASGDGTDCWTLLGHDTCGCSRGRPKMTGRLTSSESTYYAEYKCCPDGERKETEETCDLNVENVTWTPGVCYHVSSRNLFGADFNAGSEPLYDCEVHSARAHGLLIGMILLATARILLQVVWYRRCNAKLDFGKKGLNLWLIVIPIVATGLIRRYYWSECAMHMGIYSLKSFAAIQHGIPQPIVGTVTFCFYVLTLLCYFVALVIEFIIPADKYATRLEAPPAPPAPPSLPAPSAEPDPKVDPNTDPQLSATRDAALKRGGLLQSFGITMGGMKNDPVDMATFLEAGTLHVHLVSATGLKSADLNGKSDPYVRLTLAGQQAKSKTIMKSLDPQWDETFEFVGVRGELLKHKLHLNVFDWDRFSMDDKLGFACLNLEPMLHTLEHAEEVELSEQGSVSLRLRWVPQTQEQALSAATKDAGGALPVIRAQQPHKVTGKLCVHLLRGEGLKVANKNGLSDPFVKLSLGKKTHTSKTIKGTLDPRWNSKFEFQCTQDVLDTSPLKLSVFDWDMVSDKLNRNESLGYASIDLSPLLTSRGFWSSKKHYTVELQETKDGPSTKTERGREEATGLGRLHLNVSWEGDDDYQFMGMGMGSLLRPIFAASTKLLHAAAKCIVDPLGEDPTAVPAHYHGKAWAARQYFMSTYSGPREGECSEHPVPLGWLDQMMEDGHLPRDLKVWRVDGGKAWVSLGQEIKAEIKAELKAEKKKAAEASTSV